jgi:hypothetical protein
VVLPGTESGSSFLHRILTGTAEAFDADLVDAKLPTQAGVFKKSFGDALVRFEAARIASKQRSAIAKHLASATLGSLELAENGRSTPLVEALRERRDPSPTQARDLGGRPGLRAELPLDGRVYRGLDVLEAVDGLYGAHHLTAAARDALRWIVNHIEAQGGALHLRGRKFALMGAGAELSPAPMLLAADATVLWIDVSSPESMIERAIGLAGTLVEPEHAHDVLADPCGVAASIRSFAEDGPVHVGLFAYAPGASRELRVAGAMDAIVRSLGADVVRSVSMLVSPTSPGEMQREDVEVQGERRTAPALWQKVLQLGRIVRGPGHYGTDGSPVCRAVMSIQGAGYQAAQYLTKIASAEEMATTGLGDDGAKRPVTVSANVAGITATRSLSHPLFQAAFAGAPAFGVRIFEPRTTRALSGLLMLHDVLNPAAPGAATAVGDAAGRARALRAQQVHGGVYDLPWEFESAVRAAAVLGAAKKPSVLFSRKSN